MKKEKMKILKPIIIIIIILFIIFIVLIGKKAYLLFTLSEKVRKNINSNNYYAKLTQYEGTSILITETYKKDQKQMNIQTFYNNQNNENTKLIEYSDNGITKLYTESNNEKTVILDGHSAMLLPMKLSESYSTYSKSISRLIKNTIFSSISTVKCNGRDCYYFSKLETDMLGISKIDSGIYIDKETGLPIRTAGTTAKSDKGIFDPIIDFYYEFNKVTDESIREPDISQYVIKDNN